MNKKHTQALLDSAISELQFANISTYSLYNSLIEIEEMTNDPLVKKICSITRERHQIEKLVHSRKLFE